MKKVSIFMAIAAAASLASCTAQAPKANLKTDIDSLSYSIGMAQTQGLKGYLTGRLDVDTAYMAEFIKGLNEGANKTSKKDIAYMAGLQIGQQISNQMMKGINQELFAGDSTKTISKDNFMAGFIAGTLEKGGVMTMEAAQEYTRTAMETIKAKAMEEKYADNKAAGEKFLAENKTKEGVKTTESGLQYKVITEGKGEIPADTCKVKVNYKGTLIDGTEFDSSYKRNEPATFRANQVIKGWTEALTMMPVGSKWELYIPQELAYGSRESGQIKPFSTLIFEVDNLDRQILEIISQNARIPFKDVAAECGVSRAAIHQRVQRLIDLGVIVGSGYHVNPKSLGYRTCTYVGIKLEKGSMYKSVVAELQKIPEIVECHFTTGPYTMLTKLYACDNEHLMDLLNNKMQEIPGVVATETLISLEQSIKKEIPIRVEK